jgi:aspartate kinase
MARIVQKYGGTSVGDVDRIKNVAARIKAVRDAGHQLVVVVSARAGVTNELIARAKADHAAAQRAGDATSSSLSVNRRRSPSRRWRSTPSACNAVSYTGAQAGIFTDKVHTKAKIKTINAKPLHQGPRCWQRHHRRRFPRHR